MSDIELQKNASVIYNKNLDFKNEQYSLESGLFGITKSSSCTICGQNRECTLHYGLIALPYPIISNTVVVEPMVKLLKIICPCCANFPIPNAKDALLMQPAARFGFIQEEVRKLYKNDINVCPYCKNKFSFIHVENQYPLLRYNVIQKTSDKQIQLNPLYIHALLNNFSDMSCEYIGWNKQTFNPRNFMTKFIVIVPNKLRIKTRDSTSSAITSLYRFILEQIVPELNRYLKSTIGSKKIILQNAESDKFNHQYDILNARYSLIIDMTKDRTVNLALTVMGKSDRKHLDVSSSMMGKLKGKESTYFGKGIVDTRHNCSARTVLGEAPDISSYQCGFPQKYCNKMGSYIPVYEENLEIVRQFIASMSEISKHDYSRIRVNRILKQNLTESISVKSDRALVLASQIQPGDKLFVSLIPGALIMHTRFPSVREESWATHILVPTQHTVQTLPLSATKYKNADFDGDETGVYANYANYTDAEALLTHSIFRQFLDYSNGAPGIYFDNGDIKFEINILRYDMPIGVKEIYDKDFGYVKERVSFYPPTTVGKNVEAALDYLTGQSADSKFSKIAKINYCDAKLEIRNNRINPNKCTFKNDHFFAYLSTLIGAERTIYLIDTLLQNGYNLSKYMPISFGNEVRFYDKKAEKECNAIHEKTLAEMQQVEQSDLPAIQKDVKQFVLADKDKQQIIPILKQQARGTNLDKLKLVDRFSNEYYLMMFTPGQILLEGRRIPQKLADNTRTVCCFPKYSIDPAAYGYIKHGYMSSDMLPCETFYDCMMQRKSLYTRGNETAVQGYLAKRFVMAFGPNVVDHNGGVAYDRTFVSPCYGAASINPRNVFVLPLTDISLERNAFLKKYSDPALECLYDEINEARTRYARITDFITRKVVEDSFVVGFDYDQYLNSLLVSGDIKKGNTEQKLIDELIKNMQLVFSPPGMKQRYSLLNLKQLEYYFRIKLTEFKIPRDILIKLYYKFIESLVEAGETVGLKSALCVSNCLTQESLDAIHHNFGGSVDVNKLNITKGGSRFEELLGGAIHKNTILTLGFYDSSEEHVRDFAKRNETIFFKNIWSKLETCLAAQVQDDVKQLHPNIDFSKLNVSKTFIKMIWNLSSIADYDIKLSEIFNTLIEKFPKIMFITGKILNSKEFMVYIYFYPDTKKLDIDSYIQIWKSDAPGNIVHGKYLINCFVCQNKNNGEWILQANEINLKCKAFENIIFDPEIDPSKCHTTNTRTNLDVFGVFESAARLCEETIYCSSELSSLRAVLTRHYKTICLGCIASSKYFLAIGNSASKANIDYLRKINFETPAMFIKDALINGEWKESADNISGEFWADLPKSGSGYSKVAVIKCNK